MQIITLTGLRHGQWDKIKDTCCPGYTVYIHHDPKWDSEDGRAYRVELGGFVLGTIPLISTLDEYIDKAKTDTKRKSVESRKLATEKVREWLNWKLSDGKEFCSARIWEVWCRDSHGEYNTKDKGEICFPTIVFEEVE